jgi:nickel/cobalt transporter (NicO) family protein
MRKALWLIAAVFTISIATAPGAQAHPLGNFTVNRSSVLDIAPGRIIVRYAVDLAEVPTFQEFANIDTSRDGVPSTSELDTYGAAKAIFIRDGLRLTVEGQVVPLSVVSSSHGLAKGQGGLQTLRIDVVLTAPLNRMTAAISYRDENFSTLRGWREVAATASGGIAIVASDVPTTSPSNGLRAYPASSVNKPPAVTAATLRIAPGVQPSASPTQDAATVASVRLFGQDFAALIERDLSLTSITIAVLLAMLFGAVHALGPGHGKTVMAAYLVGAHGGFGHAAALGVAVSVMHTASVIALGLVTLWLASLFPAAVVYPWLALVSGVIILGLGSGMVVTRWRARRHALSRDDHDHSLPAEVSPLSRRGLVALAVSGGIVPSPTAVVVLLAAVALHRIVFGVTLIASFSVGLAASLTAIGMLVLRARTLAVRRWGTRPGSVVPLISGAAILAIGAFLTTRAAVVLSR